MADALTHLETLAKTHKYLSGAKDVVDNLSKVHTFVKKDPRDLDDAKKMLGLATGKYKPLKKYLSGVQDEVIAAAKAKFPEIPTPSTDARKRMEKIAKSNGPNGPGFEKELNTYIKQLMKYEKDLAERASYLKLIKAKCDLNIKNFTQIDRTIKATLTSLKRIFVAIPEAQAAAGGEIMKIMEAGIIDVPGSIIRNYKKLKSNAEAHEKDIRIQHAYAKSALKNAQDKKLKIVMEDAKAFFAKLF